MKRLWIAIFVLSCSTAIADQSPTCAVQIMVTTGPGLLVTVPCFSKDQLTKMVSTFFARGDESAEKEFSKLIGKANRVTLTVTTERE